MRPHWNPNRWPCEAHLDHLGCHLSSASEQCSQTREMTTACPNWWSPVRDHHMLFHSDPFKFPVCLLELSASLDALLESRNNQKQTRNDRQQNALQDMLWAYKPTSLTAWKKYNFSSFILCLCTFIFSGYLKRAAQNQCNYILFQLILHPAISQTRPIFPCAQIILCLFHNS